jgi:hypothetical protein
VFPSVIIVIVIVSCISGISGIFFLPLIFWLRRRIFPTNKEKHQNELIRHHIKRHAKMKKKKRFIAKGIGDQYRLEDEYIPDQHVYAPKEEFTPKSATRGNHSMGSTIMN